MEVLIRNVVGKILSKRISKTQCLLEFKEGGTRNVYGMKNVPELFSQCQPGVGR